MTTSQVEPNRAANALFALNAQCDCMPIDTGLLRASISAHAPETEALLDVRPMLFAGSPVFVHQEDIQAMQQLVSAMEHIVHTRAFSERLHTRAATRATDRTLRTPGLFIGYDFHLSDRGPQLIEINTNAGGAFLIQEMYDFVAQDTALCGGAWAHPRDTAWILQSVSDEWRAAGCQGMPATLAVVDTEPGAQYLAPEFELARRMFTDAGIHTLVADPNELHYAQGHLLARGRRIDMVYNRLTDFDLHLAAHAALRNAWLDGNVLLSPSPEHHLRYADKRNLAWLSDPDDPLRQQLEPAAVSMLQMIPRTLPVTANNAAQLWENRKAYYFKPANGYGSRGTYRGAKLTRKTWLEITASPAPYVAQLAVAPPVRYVNAVQTHLKYDVRAFTYAGRIEAPGGHVSIRGKPQIFVRLAAASRRWWYLKRRQRAPRTNHKASVAGDLTPRAPPMIQRILRFTDEEDRYARAC